MQVSVLSVRGMKIGLKKKKNMTCGMKICEMNNLEIEKKFVFSLDVILCG